MADNNPQLVKQWIQYLKNNQIVGLKSDPQTGRLDYRREVTTDDVSRFLELNTNYSQDEISNAIQMVFSRQSVNKSPSKLTNNPSVDNSSKTSSNTKQLPSTNSAQQKPAKKYNNNDAEEIPDKTISENIKDTQPTPLDEKDVESIFNILSSQQPGANSASPQSTSGNKRGQRNAQSSASTAAGQPVAQPDPGKKEEDLRKLKRIIRDTMIPSQRMSLWRELNE
jgi:hypothetical protein